MSIKDDWRVLKTYDLKEAKEIARDAVFDVLEDLLELLDRRDFEGAGRKLDAYLGIALWTAAQELDDDTSEVASWDDEINEDRTREIIRDLRAELGLPR